MATGEGGGLLEVKLVMLFAVLVVLVAVLLATLWCRIAGIVSGWTNEELLL